MVTLGRDVEDVGAINVPSMDVCLHIVYHLFILLRRAIGLCKCEKPQLFTLQQIRGDDEQTKRDRFTAVSAGQGSLC